MCWLLVCKHAMETPPTNITWRHPNLHILTIAALTDHSFIIISLIACLIASSFPSFEKSRYHDFAVVKSRAILHLARSL